MSYSGMSIIKRVLYCPTGVLSPEVYICYSSRYSFCAAALMGMPVQWKAKGWSTLYP